MESITPKKIPFIKQLISAKTPEGQYRFDIDNGIILHNGIWSVIDAYSPNKQVVANFALDDKTLKYSPKHAEIQSIVENGIIPSYKKYETVSERMNYDVDTLFRLLDAYNQSKPVHNDLMVEFMQPRKVRNGLNVEISSFKKAWVILDLFNKSKNITKDSATEAVRFVTKALDMKDAQGFAVLNDAEVINGFYGWLGKQSKLLRHK